MVRRLMVCLLAFLLVFGLVACGGSGSGGSDTPASSGSSSSGASTPSNQGNTPAATNEIFKIGSYLQLTGTNSAGAIQGVRVLEIFAEYVNAQGGFNGAMVETVVYDTQASAEESLKAVTKLLEIDKVNAFVSSLASNEIQPVKEIIDAAGLLHMNVGSSPATPDPSLTYFFRGAYNSNFGAPTYAKVIDESLKAKRVAILHGQDDTSFANQQAVEDELIARGIEITTKQTFDMGDIDFSAQIRTILNTNPDTIYIVVNNEINLIIKQLRQNGYNGIIFNKDSISSSAFEIAGQENCNYVVSVAPYVTYLDSADCDVPKAKEFLDIWDANTDKTPLQSWGVYSIWDSCMLLWEASKIAGTNDPVAMRDAMKSIDSYESCGGIIDYANYDDNESYHTLKAFIMIDGKYQDLANWFAAGGFEAYKSETGRSF
ncbi:MAG: ABC transporter substrate-binding protein [Oscillospiraceae bacterium]|nr:ABC transporter substrate-binding protein [Oscillospiraceae bacterium]